MALRQTCNQLALKLFFLKFQPAGANGPEKWSIFHCYYPWNEIIGTEKNFKDGQLKTVQCIHHVAASSSPFRLSITSNQYSKQSSVFSSIGASRSPFLERYHHSHGTVGWIVPFSHHFVTSCKPVTGFQQVNREDTQRPALV